MNASMFISDTSRNTRNAPTPYTYYGLSFWLRCEKHAGKWTHIAVSYHRPIDPGQRAKRGKRLFCRRYTLVTDEPISAALPIPSAVVDATLTKVLPQHVIPQMIAERHLEKTSDKPFGLLGQYAHNRLLDLENSLSPNYQRRRAKAMERMVELWGDQPIINITPALCGPDLLNMPVSLAQDCVRLLRQLWLVEIGILVADPKIWERYDLSVFARPYDPTRLIRNNMLNLPWSSACRKQAIQRCLDGIGHPKYGGHYLLALTMMTVPITVNEGCALQLDSLIPIPGYPDHYQLAISHTVYVHDGTTKRRKRAKQHTRVSITDPHQKRLLAVSNLLAQAWLRCSALHPAADDSPLLLSNKKNNKRIMPIKDYRQWLDDQFGAYAPAIINTGDQTISATYDAARHMMDTAIETLAQAGYTDAELRHQQGLPPKTMAARHYAGYDAPAVQAKMCAMQDAYHTRDTGYDAPTTTRRQYITAGEAHKTTRVRYTITLAPNTDPKDITLKLSTHYGMHLAVDSTTSEDIDNANI